MKLNFSDKERDKISSGLIDLGNITFGALVVGQIFNNQTINIYSLVGGMLFTVLLYFWAKVVTPN